MRSLSPAAGEVFTPWNPEELARVQAEVATSGWTFVGSSDDGMLMFSRAIEVPSGTEDAEALP